MTKDEDGADQRTADNLYNRSINYIRRACTDLEALNLLQMDAFYKSWGYDLQESLLFGQEKSAIGLATLSSLGIERDESKRKLYIAIGSKLGDTECQSVMAGKDYSDVESKANVVVKIIKENVRKYPNKDAKITDAMRADVQKNIKAVIPDILIPAPSKEDIERAKVSTLPRLHRDKVGSNKA